MIVSTAISILFFCALLCLVLESIGSAIGRRKTGNRHYIFLIALAGVLGATYYLPLGLISVSCAVLVIASLILSISQTQYSNLEYGDSYALILVFYALLIALCTTRNLLNFTVLTAFLNMTLVGLCYFRQSRRLISEISLKLIFGSLSYFCFLSIAIILLLQRIGSTEFAVFITHPEAKLAASFVWISMLIWVGSVPFFSTYIDYLDAAPSFASVLLLGGILVSGGHILSILTQIPLDPRLFQILVFFAGASLLIPPILGLDQNRIARMIAYLCMTQTGVVLLLALFDIALLPIFYFHMAIAIPGIMAGIRFWKHAQNSDKTWEDYAGAGRKHPFIGIAWLYLLSSIAGAPATLGFLLYLELSKTAFKTHSFWVLPLIVLAIIASMTPVARLGVFMFGKPIRYELKKLHQPRQSFFIIGSAFFLLLINLTFLILTYPDQFPKFQ